MTKDGYCIEYRETLFDHYMRIGKWMDIKPYKISPYDYGLDLGLEFYGRGKCGYYGDNTSEKPWFGDVIGGLKWEAWTKYNGTPKELCQKLFLKDVHKIMEEYGFGYLIKDPKRPGPDYYSECNKFNWAASLV